MTKLTRKATGNGPGGSTTGSLEGDLGDEQLRLVGLIVLEWNEIEFLVSTITYSAMGLPGEHWVTITSGLSFDSQRSIILNEAFKSIRLPEDFIKAIDRSFAAAKIAKQSRDGVTHARVTHGTLAIGMNFKRAAGTVHVQETNLSASALSLLRDHLKIIRAEILASLNLVDMWKSAANWQMSQRPRIPTDEETLAVTTELSEVLTRLTSLQEERAKLEQNPAFPY
ncbi:hypothetical protein PQQ88_01360 [Paraburkholderia caledonica]|uniref:hypothetical protein n=1 Tax=Paraburkholderia caledonica TaxID=134536 RepID=UPI0038B9A716